MAFITVKFEYSLPPNLTEREVQEQFWLLISEYRDGKYPPGVEELERAGIPLVFEAVRRGLAAKTEIFGDSCVGTEKRGIGPSLRRQRNYTTEASRYENGGCKDPDSSGPASSPTKISVGGKTSFFGSLPPPPDDFVCVRTTRRRCALSTIFEDQERQDLVSFKGRGHPGDVLEKGILTSRSSKRIEFIWVVDTAYRIWVAEPGYSFKIKGKSRLLKVEFSVVNLDWLLHKLVEWHDYYEGCEDMRSWTQEGPSEATRVLLKRPITMLQVRTGPFEKFSLSWGRPVEPLVLEHATGSGCGCCDSVTYKDALGWLWSNSSHDGVYRIPGLDHEA